MKKTVIQDLNPYIPNERNGTYGGKAGDKEGITINGEYWIVKYPNIKKNYSSLVKTNSSFYSIYDLAEKLSVLLIIGNT